MPSPKPMSEPLTDTVALTGEESALFARVLAGVALSPEAERAIRDLVGSLLAKRTADLHVANASLQKEVHERRLVEIALRDSEARLRDLALTSADWIWEIDAKGRYTSCSDRVKDVLGYSPDEIVGRTPFDLMVEEDAAAIAPVFQRLARGRHECSELKNRNRHKDGHEVVLLTSCVPMVNEAGELLGFRGTNKDITVRERMEHSLRQRTIELEALLEAGRAIAATIDYDEVLRRVARAAGEALGTAECAIWEHSPDEGLAVFRCLWERDPAPGVAEDRVGASHEIEAHTGGLDGLRAGLVVQQSRSDPDLPAADAGDMDAWGEKTWLNVPLVMDGRLLGVMILIETQRERRFDPDEMRMAGVIGEQAAAALHNALRHRREEEQNRWLRSLVGAGRAISAAPDPDAALSDVARFAAEAVQSPAAFVYELSREKDALVTRARCADGVRRDDAVGDVFPVSNSPQDRRALDAGEVFVETLSDPALPAEVRELMEAFGEQTLLNVPLRSRGDALGMLVLIEDQRERVFSAEELDFMGAFGEQVTLALTTARSATTDGLTGLANHRVFYERLGQELARAQRYETPVSLLMIDIDDFKELNDTHGHPAGDEALRRLGRLLAAHLRRDIDLPARYGGEEFAVVLPNTGVGPAEHEGSDQGARPDGGAPGHPEGAETLAERLRRVIAGTDFPVTEDGPPVRVAVSIGVASYPDMAGNMDELVARADAALYAAKRAGKDRVEVYWRRDTEAAANTGAA